MHNYIPASNFLSTKAFVLKKETVYLVTPIMSLVRMLFTFLKTYSLGQSGAHL